MKEDPVSMHLSPLSRRSLFNGAIATGALLTAPRLATAQDRRVIRFVPAMDLAVLDPIMSTAGSTLVHSLVVYDTLYGLDEGFRPHPQMVAGHTIEDDGLTWIMTLREGLRFHDGEPVLARDAAASVRRWGARDMYGQEVIARANEITALDDRRLRFRLKAPFSLLADALGKNGPSICVIMPERLAQTAATQQVTEAVGSGPYRFLKDEQLAGARVAYQRFEEYVPRPDGVASRMAGPKIAHFDRIEWIVMPDPATRAAALSSGEVDWVEELPNDMAPIIRRRQELALSTRVDTTTAILRMNHVQPPFNNPAIRRAILGAVKQDDYMTAAYGVDRALWKSGVGFFSSNSPMASDAGMELLNGPRDMEKVKRDLAAAGYAGERVVLMQPEDWTHVKALSEVAFDMLRRAGMNVDMQNSDWNTIAARRASRAPINQGGWNIFMTSLTNSVDPGGHLGLRANGEKAWFGWPNSPKLEALRQDWFSAPNAEARAAICEQIQLQAFEDVPCIPVGEYRALGAAKRGLTGFAPGTTHFYGVRWEDTPRRR
jgi:peptide/nickel transport system substrate-binding protein